MLIKKLGVSYLILLIILSSVLTISVKSDDASEPYSWNNNWSYNQELNLPISTNNELAKNQPIDIKISFEKRCWGKNEKEHSIRVCCWDGYNWHELESQIYDIKFKGNNDIDECGLVFLVPKFADGSERYFVYYDNNEKKSPNYKDHVNVTDEYFYYEPISGLIVEGDYYEITEDDYVIYGVGQKGQIINRKLSQVVIKQKKGVKEFDVINSDIIASLCFSYYKGVNDEDEISSDQSLVSKKINVDGNLMLEFGIVSESSDKRLRTTNVYKYYYSPNQDKRICVHSKHQCFKNSKVSGITNIDGRYGALISYKSKIGRSRFGEILPYLHTIDENNRIREYSLIKNPENKNHEWIISYKDDCDIGKNPWISYDEGNSGKAHALIFSLNENIVKKGTNERDGFQIKTTEREYLDVIGAELDYASIMYGRNSYEKGGKHDLDIPDDLTVEYCVEFFSTENNSYKAVIEEEVFFRSLVKYRHDDGDGSFEGDENIYTLTVYSLYSGRISFPLKWYNITKGLLPIVFMELYKDGVLVSSKYAYNPLLAAPRVKFPKLSKGDYVVKVYRIIGKNIKNFIGIKSVKVDGDTKTSIYSTWQKQIKISLSDQNNKKIKDANIILFRNNTIVTENITNGEEDIEFLVPYNLFKDYDLKIFYKDFIIYNKKVPARVKKIDVKTNLYDLKIKTKDNLGLPPGVNVRPFITSPKMYIDSEIIPENLGYGIYFFKNIPEATYDLIISFGSFTDKKIVNIPNNGKTEEIKFSAHFNLKNEIFDSYGNQIKDGEQEIDIIRNNKKIYESISYDKIVDLPPGTYTINVFSENKLIGSKTILLTNDKNIHIVTSIKPIMPSLALGLIIIFILQIIVLLIFKRISLNTFLKLLAISLIILSLFQPWWILDAKSIAPVAEKHSELLVIPKTIMESFTYEGKTHLDIATIPVVFTDFLGILLLIVCSGFVLLGLSFIPNIFLKRRYSLLLIFSSSLFLIIIGAAFCMGMAKITEISLGSLQGSGIIDVAANNGDTIYINAHWGMGLGFHLCIIGAIIALMGGIIDYLRSKKWPNWFFKKS